MFSFICISIILILVSTAKCDSEKERRENREMVMKYDRRMMDLFRFIYPHQSDEWFGSVEEDNELEKLDPVVPNHRNLELIKEEATIHTQKTEVKSNKIDEMTIDAIKSKDSRDYAQEMKRDLKSLTKIIEDFKCESNSDVKMLSSKLDGLSSKVDNLEKQLDSKLENLSSSLIEFMNKKMNSIGSTDL